VQGFLPYDRMAWPLYEVIAEHKLPAIFHSGHSGIGSGMRCGGGLRLQNSNPMLLEDVAIDFPDMQIVVAHPSWPWQDEALSLALHKPNVWIDLSGWSPKYFPPQLVQYANTLLKDRMLFGSDYPLITPERWMKDFDEAGFKDKVKPLILKENAKRLLIGMRHLRLVDGLDAAPRQARRHLGRGVRQQDAECRVAQACHDVERAPHAGLQPLRHLLQAGIGRRIAACGSVTVEVIDIDHQHGQRRAQARAARPFLGQSAVEQAAVAHLGRRIDFRQRRQLVFAVDQFGDVDADDEPPAVRQLRCGKALPA
jgi:hypothetical protein